MNENIFKQALKSIMLSVLNIVETKGYLYWHEGLYKLPDNFNAIKNKLKVEAPPLFKFYSDGMEYDDKVADLESFVKSVPNAQEVVIWVSSRLDKNEETPFEIKALLHRLFAYHSMKQNIILRLMQDYFQNYLGYNTEGENDNHNFIIYRDKVRIVKIESLSGEKGFIQAVDMIRTENSNQLQAFYRGHKDINYTLEPSLFRNKSIANRESELCFEIISRRPDEFESCKTHLEKLSKIQHFASCTRLLDFTTNPLVALYFACKGDNGEVIVLAPEESRIKNAYSDTITILASLHRMTASEQEYIRKMVDNDEMTDIDFNANPLIKRFLHVIKDEKPSFRDEIRKESLIQDMVVYPFKNNPRIIRQEGVFAIKSLSKKNGFDEMRMRDSAGNLLVFHITNTDKIRSDLDLMGINQASLFPDIQHIADHYQDIYKTERK